MSEQEDEIQKFLQEMWAFWVPLNSEFPPCIRCGAPAVCLHEIEPRSLHRWWFRDSFNSVPVCDDCHKWAGVAGDAGQIELGQLSTDRLRHARDWKGPNWDGKVRELFYVHNDINSGRTGQSVLENSVSRDGNGG